MESSIGLVYISEASGIQEVRNMSVNTNMGFTVVEFDTVLQSFDVMNRNQRMYDGSNIWQCIETSEKIQSQLAHNGWFSELDHPYQRYKNVELTPERIQSIDYASRCSVIKRPQLKSNMLYGHIVTTPGTENGRGLASDMIAVGYKPMYSLRAIANMVMRNSKPYVNARKVITYDTVNYASHREADMVTPGKVSTKVVPANGILESAGNDYIGNLTVESCIIPLNEILQNIGKDPTIEVVMESFDLCKDDLIGFSANKKQAIIKDRDNRIYINMNQKSCYEVQDFLSSF